MAIDSTSSKTTSRRSSKPTRTTKSKSNSAAKKSVAAKAKEAAKKSAQNVKTQSQPEDDSFTNAEAHKMVGQTKSGLGLLKPGLKAARKLAPLANAATKASQLIGNAGKVLGPVSTATGVVQAGIDIKDAIQSGEKQDIISATKSGTAAASSVLSLGAGSVQTAMAKVQGDASKAAANAMKSVGASAAVSQAVADDVAKVTKEALMAGKDVSRQALGEATRNAAKEAIAKSGTTTAKSVAGAGTRSAARSALSGGGKAAAQAATKAAAGSSAKILAKAGGRFVPGANVAIAALDAAKLAATLADPEASTTKKVASTITALGSAVAATNIPFVSQGGAVVSAVSSFVGAFWG